MMKISKFYFTTLIMIVLSSSCSKKQEHQPVLNQKNLVVNTKIKASIKEVFEFKKNLILEDNENGRFTGIHKLKIKNDIIYIMDKFGQHYVYVFDSAGKFIRRIGQRGRGPSEYNRLCDFDVDNGGNIHMYSRQYKKMLIYDSLGNSVKVIKTPFRADGFSLLNNGGYIFSVLKDSESLTGKPKVLVTDSSMNINKQHFSYSPEYKSVKGNTDIFRECSEGLLSNRTVDDNIYLFDKNTGEIKKSFYVDFGDEALPKEYKDDFGKYIEKKYKTDNEFIYMDIPPVLISERMVGVVRYKSNGGLFMYDLNSKKSFVNQFDVENPSVKDLGRPLFVLNDSIMVSYIDSYTYDNSKDSKVLGKNVKNHMEKGGFVLSFFSIKK